MTSDDRTFVGFMVFLTLLFSGLVLLAGTLGGCEPIDPATFPENVVQRQIGGVCKPSPRSYVDVECAKGGQLLFCNLVRGTAGCWVPSSTSDGRAAEQ